MRLQSVSHNRKYNYLSREWTVAFKLERIMI